MKLYGLTLHAHIHCPDAADCTITPTTATFTFPNFPISKFPNFSLAIGFSFHCPEHARANCDAAPDFDTAARLAHDEWEAALSAIEIDTPDPESKRRFYSQFYHSLIKPARLDDPSPYDASPSYYMDFATLWDQYKTQLPLVLTLYPDRAADMCDSLVEIGRKHGLIPCAIILNNRTDFCDMQARMLASYVICSAYNLGVAGIDYRAALEVMWSDLQTPRNAQFLATGFTERNTHILDLADACHYLAQLAADLGDTPKHDELTRLSRHWRNAYDPSTGLLRTDKEYYEGTAANYSFRLLHDMPARIAIAGGPRAFELALDRFFGLDGGEDAVQQTDPRDHETMRRGFALGRFEGFNNEPDMETPYNYIFVGRHDKLCDILTAGMNELFSADSVGLPGNNDSGGLSSCFIWNTLGIFPAFASRFFLLGRPFYPRATLRLPLGKILTILAHDLTPTTPYVHRITFNSTPVTDYRLPAKELLSGGTLEFWMGHDKAPTLSPTPTNK